MKLSSRTKPSTSRAAAALRMAASCGRVPDDQTRRTDGALRFTLGFTRLGPRRRARDLGRVGPAVYPAAAGFARAWPARSTVAALLKQQGLITSRRRPPRPPKANGLILAPAKRPNEVWTTDFKGEFLTR